MLNSALIMSALEYPIYLNVGANGTASISKTKAKRGERIDINCSPIAAWRVASCTSPQVVIQGSGNSRWFYMPDSVVDISVTFEEIPPEEGFKRTTVHIEKHKNYVSFEEDSDWQYGYGTPQNSVPWFIYWDINPLSGSKDEELIYRGVTTYIDEVRISNGQRNNRVFSYLKSNVNRNISVWHKP